MLFAVIPAAAAVLSWLVLGQRPDIGIAIGLLAGGGACWLNSRASSRRRAAGQSPSRTAGRCRRAWYLSEQKKAAVR